MIISQAPLRISLFGGGSDLPNFLESEVGEVLSFTIDKCVYLIAHPFTHRTGISIKYSKFEDVSNPSQLEHPIFRTVLSEEGINNLDIAVMADIPAGTGLGSSSSFTVALLALAKTYKGIQFSPRDLAEAACEIEVRKLGEPIGFQDQWAAALGGINLISFNRLESVEVESIILSSAVRKQLNSNLLLVPVGNPRSASKLLQEQSANLSESTQVINFTRKIVGLVEQGKQALHNNLDDIGPLLNENWQLKRQLASGISSLEIDALVERALNYGATGTKLLGAGGSGYLACYVPEENSEKFKDAFQKRLTYAISDRGAGILNEY